MTIFVQKAQMLNVTFVKDEPKKKEHED